jgi:Flp pilus assembly protein TadD
MIITEQFVFIHLHKTGGQSLNDMIKRCMTNHRVVGYHFPRSEVPTDAATLPLVGMVRNPWDWYVSWYAFNKRPNIRNPLFEIASDGGSADFKSTITNLVRLGSDDSDSVRRRDDLIRLLPETLDGNRGVGLTKDSIRELSESGLGYYSWLFGRMLGNEADDKTFIGRFENLQEDFLDIMLRLDVKETDRLRQELESRERKNFSQHSHYSHYYDDELCDLVAEYEGRLIERFDYKFESIKPPGISYEFPNDPYSGENHGFRKLLGREKNFLQLHNDFDVTAIRQIVDDMPPAKWLESDRDRLFAVHRDTQALLMVHFEDYQYKKPDYRDLYSELADNLQPVVDYVANYYQNNGFIVRMILAKLVAGGSIPKHTDAGFSLLNCHRVHLPIITNDDVVFSVGGEEINMRAGELWEINNGTVHAVENRSSEDRVHLIIDWMPNHAGKSEEEVLTPDELDEDDSAAANAAMLDTLIERAQQQHRSGDVRKAESLYRQVLHFDGDHVVANNLLGLLCLQTKRFDEAVENIEKALGVMPDDAQAHANLGLAFKGLNRFEDAGRHFQESLKLAPDNPRAYNNLGSIFISLGEVREAAMCFHQALTIQPDLPEVHFNLGSALLHLQHYNEAIASLQQCLELKPDFAEARGKLEQAQQEVASQETAT